MTTCRRCGLPINGQGVRYCRACVPPIVVGRGNGYIMIYLPNHHAANKAGYVKEHLVVAEGIVGRELLPGEVVHHKDGNTHNNAPENLQIFKNSGEHQRHHMKLRQEEIRYHIERFPQEEWLWLWENAEHASSVELQNRVEELGYDARVASKIVRVVSVCFVRLILAPASLSSVTEKTKSAWSLFLSFKESLTTAEHGWSDRYIERSCARFFRGRKKKVGASLRTTEPNMKIVKIKQGDSFEIGPVFDWRRKHAPSPCIENATEVALEDSLGGETIGIWKRNDHEREFVGYAYAGKAYIYRLDVAH